MAKVAVGIECRTDDARLHALLAPLECKTTRVRVFAERAMNRALEGGCQVPIGSYAEIEADGQVFLKGLVGAVDGSEILRAQVRGSSDNAEALGLELAQSLLSQGADKILKQVYEQE